MSDLAQIIKYLCAYAGTESVDRDPMDSATMRGAFAAILDGGASDIELGALIAAAAAVHGARRAALYTEIVLGLEDAIRDRLAPITGPSPSRTTVVIPNYGCNGRGNAIPLIAMKLRHFGIPVLVHGALETSDGLSNCGVFRELGVLPASTRAQAERHLLENGIALVPLTLVSSGLAAMLSVKNHLGVLTPAHVLADMLMPVMDDASRTLHVLNLPSWLQSSADELTGVQSGPVLMVAGEADGLGSVANRPGMSFRAEDASARWQPLFTAEALPRADSMRHAGELPAGVSALAAWTRARLDGKAILPVPVVNQLAACLYSSGYAEDFNQAKAVAAVETGLAAA